GRRRVEARAELADLLAHRLGDLDLVLDQAPVPAREAVPVVEGREAHEWLPFLAVGAARLGHVARQVLHRELVRRGTVGELARLRLRRAVARLPAAVAAGLRAHHQLGAVRGRAVAAPATRREAGAG